MRVLVFDPFHGAAGDMITGALLGCGADKNLVMRAMRSVVAKPSVRNVMRAGIRAVKISTNANTASRTLDEVMERIDEASNVIPKEALAMARRVFERLNTAEELVHGAHTHFHEVGADDAIADVIGACTAIHSLAVDGVAVFPISVGRGVVSGSHGTFPIPAPATVEILKKAGLTIQTGDIDGELCTPTGAALLAEFFRSKPSNLGAFTIHAVGYGAGSRNPPHIPNVLRAMVVEADCSTGALQQDSVEVLETNIDDVSGEVIAHAIARIMNEGARDVSASPVTMKKGRPGFLIRVICTKEKSAQLAELMADELGTLGIRCSPSVHRFIAERTIEQVEVEIAGKRKTMPLKCGWMHGRIYTMKAEFDKAQEWAVELGMPIREVLQFIENQGRNQIKNQSGSDKGGQ